MFDRRAWLRYVWVMLVAGCAARRNGAAPGTLEGHLAIVSPKPVELADEGKPIGAPVRYADYPLVVVAQGDGTTVATIVADANGNYRIALPPGRYLLDAQGRAPKRVRAQPRAFTVLANQAVRVDMALDTGIR